MAYFVSISQIFAQIFQQLTDFILKGMDKGFHSGMVLVDLQKAFYTLYHTVFLQKMEYAGF